MTTYNVVLLVNGVRTTLEIKADCSTNAIKIANAQFPTGKVQTVSSK